MKLYWIKVDPKSNDWCLYESVRFGDENTHKEKHVTMEAESGVMQL